MYRDFKEVRLEQILEPEKSGGFVTRKAEIFSSVWIESNGNGNYEIHVLPIEAQMFPIFSFLVGDVDNDSNPDILAVGNLHAVQPELGRYDAGLGLMMKWDGKGSFTTLPSSKSGFLVRGEGRDIKLISGLNGKKSILVSRNNDSVLVFKHP